MKIAINYDVAFACNEHKIEFAIECLFQMYVTNDEFCVIMNKRVKIFQMSFI